MRGAFRYDEEDQERCSFLYVAERLAEVDCQLGGQRPWVKWHRITVLRKQSRKVITCSLTLIEHGVDLPSCGVDLGGEPEPI